MLSSEIEQALKKAKMQLLFNREAAAFLIPYSYLPITESTKVPTFGTDGRQILINPEFFHSLPTFENVVAVYFHEIIHNVLGHTAIDFPKVTHENILRIAKEIAVNNIVINCGLTLPEGIIDRSYDRWSTLAIYKDLADNAEKIEQYLQDGSEEPDDGNGEGNTDGSETPDGQDTKSGCQCCIKAKDAKNLGGLPKHQLGEAPTQASVLRKLAEIQQGLKNIGNDTMTGLIGELIEDIAVPPIDWAEQLKDSFIRSFDGTVQDLANPIKQYMPEIYIPRYKDDSIENLVIALDLSSSLNQEELSKAQRVIQEIRELYEIDVTSIITYNEEIIARVDYEQYDTIDISLMEGFGGTRGDCVFEYLHEKGETPHAVLMITDTEDCIYTPAETVQYPVIWLNTSDDEPFNPEYCEAPKFGIIVSI